MDAELKALLVALAEGQVKLAEGQGRHDGRMGKLAEGQGRHDERLGRLESALLALAEGQVKLAEGQGRHDERMGKLVEGQVKLEGAIAHLATATEAALTRLTARVDEFGERVTRGFTNGASTDRKLDDELHALDARVTELERKKPGPKKRR